MEDSIWLIPHLIDIWRGFPITHFGGFPDFRRFPDFRFRILVLVFFRGVFLKNSPPDKSRPFLDYFQFMQFSGFSAKMAETICLDTGINNCHITTKPTFPCFPCSPRSKIEKKTCFSLETMGLYPQMPTPLYSCNKNK